MPTEGSGYGETTDRTCRSVYVVIPVYNEADTLEALAAHVLSELSGRRGRVVFVDDGSTDDSGAICDRLSEKYENVETVHFDRNRGKTAALAAGFARTGDADAVITMDSDLQDDPVEIPRFIAALEDGLDLVCGWKKQRHDPWTKRWPSKVYNGFTARVFGLRLHDINCGFKAMRGDVARAAVLRHDYHRLLPAIAKAQGFRVGEIVVNHHPRRFGQSKFGLERYWRGLRDVARLWWEVQRGIVGPAAGEN